MPNTIRHKRSGTAASIPAAGTLAAGELAVNTADGRVYTKRDSGTVVDVAQAILATGQTIVCALGSAGACGVAPVGDLHTGLFFGSDIVNVSTGGVQRMQVNAAGNVGIGNAGQNAIRLFVQADYANATGAGMQINALATASSGGTFQQHGITVTLQSDIAAGITNNSTTRGVFVQCLRNSVATDNGTLTAQRGLQVQYGNSNINAASTAVTGDSIGLQLAPLLGPGTITTLYDLFIGSLAFNTGTVTTHYAIYQAQASARNVFLGRVGCNTTTPATALDVVGQITVSAGTLALPSIVFANDANTGLFSSTADTINLVTGGVTRLTVGATGTVTTAGDHTVNGTLRATAGLQSTGARSLFRAVNEQYAVGSAYSATSGFVYFGARNESATPDAVISNAGGATLMTLQNGGNVGIGTTNPTLGRLQVTTPTDVTNAYFLISANSGGSAEGVIINDDRGFAGINSGKSLVVRTRNDGLNDTGAIASFETVGGSVINALWVGIAGNVGIGTTSPSQKLDVNGNVRVTGNICRTGASAATDLGLYSETASNWIRLACNSGDIRFFVDAAVGNQFQGGTASAVLTSAGNFGIGTPSPAARLEVAGTATITGVLTVSAGTAAAPAIVPTGDTNTGRFHPAADTIAWATAGVERLRIASDGAVSIPGEFKPTAITEALIAIGGSGNAVTLSIANGTVLTITNNSTIVVPYNGPRLTITMPPPASPGKRFTLMMTVVATGSAVLIWNTVPYSGSVKWPGNTDPTISGWAGAPSLFPFYVFDFVSDGINWYGSASSAYLTN